mgnify:CR=1 FL=1
MESTTQQEPVVEEQGTPGGAARLIRHVNRVTKKRFSAEDKIRIVLEGFRKELPISDLCRRDQVSSAIFYKWSKDFMEGGKAELKGDTLRSVTRDEAGVLKQENAQLKALAGEQALELSDTVAILARGQLVHQAHSADLTPAGLTAAYQEFTAESHSEGASR